jgi:thiol-disulfide isomerase/thioredoxin
MKKVLGLVLSVLFLSGCSVTPIKELNNDAKRFSEEYSNIKVDEKNPMVYKTDKEIIDILKSGTGIIYFGFSECPWCQNAVPVLLEAAKEMDIKEIYYFNPKEIRDNNTDTYKEIVKLLGDSLTSDENGNKRLYVPDVYFVSDGKIVGHNFKTVTTQTDPKNNPLTTDQKTELKKIYKGLISKTYNIECNC